MFYNYFKSPIGIIEIKYDTTSLISFTFVDKIEDEKFASEETPSLILNSIAQLTAYFNGTLQEFNLPLKLNGTNFQQQVWTELSLIKYGTTTSYLQLAKQLGDKNCIRAAASANGKNRFMIVIPCHRVIGTNGSLIGYAGELWRKQWLLEHEAKITGKFNPRLF